jgi:hypothetical protein
MSEFNQVDMANIMYAFVAMKAAPGLQALDAMAQHVNTNYSLYGQVEMTQMMYGFSRLSFHPGAVVGRVMVVFQRHPDLFDANSKRLLRNALPALEGSNPQLGILNSRDFDDVASAEQKEARATQRRTEAEFVAPKSRLDMKELDDNGPGLSREDLARRRGESVWDPDALRDAMAKSAASE